MQALLVPVGKEWHAVELAAVREVVRATATAPVPRTPSWLVGLANLRGDIVPIVDTLAALGAPEPVDAPASHFVVVDTRWGRAGMIATGAPETVSLDAPSGGSDHEGACGRYTLGGRVATLVDVERLGGR